MRRSLDDQIMELVRSLDAEKATVTMSFHKDSWWTRRGKGTERPFEIELQWGDHRDVERTFTGIGRSFADALESLTAEVAAHLMKGALEP
jgi:hypothetical protein